MFPSFLQESLQRRRGLTNFVRLIPAVTVLLSHSNRLSDFNSDPTIGDTPLGEIAVPMFSHFLAILFSH